MSIEDLTASWQSLNQDIITCRACPRLVSWREQVAREKRRAYRDFDYWGRPVPGFGDHRARLLVIGLAPGAHGANRTGRVFTGDGSGDFLYEALYEAGFASQPTSRHRDDGMVLTDAFITAVGRCAPPANRPTADELNTCRPYLARELQLMPQIEVIVTLGLVAFDGCRRVLGELGYKFPRLKFGHALHYPPAMTHPQLPHILTCYHPSRQNTNTGRLTQTMLNDVFKQARSLLSS